MRCGLWGLLTVPSATQESHGPCLALPLILDTVLINTLECFNISCTYTINLSVSFPHSSVVYNIPCNFQRVSGFKRVASFNSKWMSWVACWNLMKKVLLQVLHGPNLLVFVQIMTSRQQCPTFLMTPLKCYSTNYLKPDRRKMTVICWGYLITTYNPAFLIHSQLEWKGGGK